jgi:Ca-activated chloride channel family protein
MTDLPLIQSLLTSLQQFHFLRPLWFAIVPIIFLLMWRLRHREIKTDWQHFIDTDLLQAMLLRYQANAWLTPRRLAVTAFFLCVFILAGPSWQKQNTPLADDQAPLVIVLSLDSSMQTEDLQPSRLAQAKLKIQELLSRRQGSPTALIVYAGSSHIVLPLTEDVSLLSFYLEELTPEIMPEAGNRPERAMDQALQLLSASHGGDEKTREESSAGSIVFVASELGRLQQWPETLFGLMQQKISLSFLWVAGEFERQQGPVIDQAKGLGMSLIPIQPGNQDVDLLQKKILHHWQDQQMENESVAWIDGGYYFLWLLFVLMLIWFRRGMVLQW